MSVISESSTLSVGLAVFSPLIGVVPPLLSELIGLHLSSSVWLELSRHLKVILELTLLSEGIS